MVFQVHLNGSKGTSSLSFVAKEMKIGVDTEDIRVICVSYYMDCSYCDMDCPPPILD